MALTSIIKSRILDAVRTDRNNYDSDNRHAKALGLSSSVYNAVKQGKTDKQMSEATWTSLARRLGVALTPEAHWVAVETETYKYISSQLRACQERSLSAILCDVPNIGKTYTARLYAKNTPRVAYIDCSQVKTKRKLVRAIAQAFGVSLQGRYEEMYADLIYYLQSIGQPLIILDEAGDLTYEAFVEIKALWNATEHCCGWYMMGADGLRAKINRCIEYEKVGYAEIFSRFGGRYSRVSPENTKEFAQFALAETLLVARANCPEGEDAKKLARAAGGLRRLYTDVMKIRMTQHHEPA